MKNIFLCCCFVKFWCFHLVFGPAKMSANHKRSKEVPRDDSIEAKMKYILADITSIEEKTKRLAEKREVLVQQYEKLKDAKLIRDAKSCDRTVEQDWENGMHDEHKLFDAIYLFANNYHLLLQKSSNGRNA